jgi:hypothetical protein
MEQATKRYMREFIISMTAYVIVLIVAVTAIDWLPADSLWLVPLALAPIVPIIFLLIAFLRYLNGIDEMQQRIQLHAIGFATGAISLLTFAYGLLENVGFPQLSYIWIFPATIMLWGLAVSYYSRRYA